MKGTMEQLSQLVMVRMKPSTEDKILAFVKSGQSKSRAAFIREAIEEKIKNESN
jgi:predicted DNA-binding protein